MRPRHLIRPVIVALIAAGAAAFALAEGEWKASYLTNPKKADERTTLTDPAQLEDKHWLTVQFSDYQGFRPSMAIIVEEDPKEDLPEAETEMGKMFRDIARFSREDDERSKEAYSPAAMNPKVRPIVRAALGKTNRFRMVDRGVALKAGIAEQDFGASGRVSRKSAVKIGNIHGASYGVRATVIEINPEKDVKSIQVGAGIIGMAGGVLGGIAVGGKVAFCRLNIEVVDLETSDIIFDTMVDGTASEKTRSFGAAALGLLGGRLPFGFGGGGVKSEEKQEAILTDAINACAMKAAHTISTRMKDRPFQTAVSRVNGSKVTILGGSDLGMREGMMLELLSRVGVITDPETGDTVGVETERIGAVRLVEAKERWSACEIVEGGQGAKAGDFVRYEMKR